MFRFRLWSQRNPSRIVVPLIRPGKHKMYQMDMFVLWTAMCWVCDWLPILFQLYLWFIKTGCSCSELKSSVMMKEQSVFTKDLKYHTRSILTNQFLMFCTYKRGLCIFWRWEILDLSKLCSQHFNCLFILFVTASSVLWPNS